MVSSRERLNVLSHESREANDPAGVAGARLRRVRRADEEGVGAGERRQHRAVLYRERSRDRQGIAGGVEPRPQVVLPAVVRRAGRRRGSPARSGRPRPAGRRRARAAPAPGTGCRRRATRPDCRAGRAAASRRGGRASAACRAASRSARSRASMPWRRERRLHEIVVADRGAAERDEDVGAGLARGAMRCVERLERVAGDAEIDRPRRRPRSTIAATADRRSRRRSGRGRRCSPGAHQLVAGGEDRDARPAPDRERRRGPWRRRARGRARRARWPAASSTSPAREIEPARRGCARSARRLAGRSRRRRRASASSWMHDGVGARRAPARR